MRNIMSIYEPLIEKYIEPMDLVSNGSDIGRYIGKSKRGVYVVAWGEKAGDAGVVKKLLEYVDRFK